MILLHHISLHQLAKYVTIGHNKGKKLQKYSSQADTSVQIDA